MAWGTTLKRTELDDNENDDNTTIYDDDDDDDDKKKKKKKKLKREIGGCVANFWLQSQCSFLPPQPQS